jgi:hypothetical protein
MSSIVFGAMPSPVNITTTGSLLALLDVVIQVAEQPSTSSLMSRGFDKLPVSANDGAGGDAVWIWTLIARSNATVGAAAAITGIVVAVNEVQRAAASASGYIQLPGDLNSGTGGALVTVHVIRGGGSVAAGSQNSVDAALASQAIFGLILGRELPANSTVVPGDLNHGVVGAVPLYMYAVTAPYSMTSVAITWRPCECSVGLHFICLSGVAASTSNTSAPLSYTAPLCARINVLPRLAPKWTTATSKTREFAQFVYRVILHSCSDCIYRPPRVYPTHACSCGSVTHTSHIDFGADSSECSVHSFANKVAFRKRFYSPCVRLLLCYCLPFSSFSCF